MSLRPMKGNHSRRRRYSQLKSQRSYKGWEGWSWRAVKKSQFLTRDFYKHKKGIGLLVLLSLVVLFTVDQALKVSAPGPINHPSPLDPDIVTPLWSATSPNSDNSEFNVNSRVAFASATLWTGSKALRLQPNGTSNGYALALSKTGFDPSTVSGKHLKLFYFWKLITRTSWATGQRFYMYLTRNATLPTSSSYDPQDDNNVALILTFEPQGSDYIGFVFIQKNPIETIRKEDTGSCASVSSCLLSQSIFVSNGAYNPTVQANQMGYWLNFTGTSTVLGNDCAASGTFPQGGNGCSTMILTPGNTIRADTGSSGPNQKVLPALPFQGQNYYVGFYWPGASNVVADFAYDSGNANMPNQVDPTGIIAAPGVHSMQIGVAQIIATITPIAPTLDTGGWFGPVIKALINIGVFIFNGILSFIAFVTPALQAALVYLESIFVTTLDLIGGALGFPGLGSNIATFISNSVTFFVSYLPTIFSNFGTLFSDFLTNISVLFPWIPIVISIAVNLSTLALNSIVFGIKLVTLSFTLVSGIFMIVLMGFYFIYTGDDALGGLLAFFEFAEWLSIGLGVKRVFQILNWGLDIFLFFVGLIPKPIIQVSIQKIPRLPSVEVNAHFVPPSFDLAELRAGNMFAIWEWFMGFYFLGWYEQVTPALPGSLGALLPATASHLTPITGMLNILQVGLIIVSAMTFIVWPVLKMFSLIGVDIGLQDAFGIGPGRKISSGPGGIKFSKGTKHLQGRIQKKIVARASEKTKERKIGRAFFEAREKNEAEITAKRESERSRETGERIAKEASSS